MRSAAAGVAAGLLVLVVLVLAFVRPFAIWPREVSEGTATPTARFANVEVPVRAGGEACVADVTISARARGAHFQAVGPQGRAGPPFDVSVTGPGYRSESRIPPGWGPDQTRLSAPIEPPDESLRGTVCIRNTGTRRAKLFATNEVVISNRVSSTIDGEASPAEISLTFTRRRDVPIADRPGLLFQRATMFGPFGPWVAWLLAIALTVGAPLLVLWAVFAAGRRDA